MIEHLNAVLTSRTVTSSAWSVYMTRLAKFLSVSSLLRLQKLPILLVVPLQERPPRNDARIGARSQEQKDLHSDSANEEQYREGRCDTPCGTHHKDREGDYDGDKAEVDIEDASELASWATDAAPTQETVISRPYLVQESHCYYYRFKNYAYSSHQTRDHLPQSAPKKSPRSDTLQKQKSLQK